MSEPIDLNHLPAGTITNNGVVGEDGKMIPLKPSQRPAEYIEVKPDAIDDVPVTRVEVQHPCVCVAKKPVFDAEQLKLIKAKVAGNCTDTEFQLLMYMANQYGLDPLLKQIWAVKFGDSPAQIYAGRDGFLEIAHRSGQFNGMKSWCEYDEKNKPVKGKCIVYRKDMEHPFETEVLFSEYTTGKNLWASKPSIMIIKVAESVCLRKAFSVSGIYAPEEMDK